MLKISNLFRLLLLFSLSAGLLGCAAIKQPETEAEPQKVFVGSKLRNLEQVRVNETRLADGTLVVQLEAYNDSSRVLEGYRVVEWFDADGMKLKYVGSKWRPFRVQGDSFFTLRQVAPGPKAETYRIQLKKSIK